MASLSLPAEAAPQVSQLYQFTYPTAVENLFSLPNRCLLLSTSADANLYYIDPEALFPSAQHVITLPGSIRLTGIAALGDNLYAVAGAATNPERCMQVYVIKVLTEGLVNVTLDHVVPVPDTVNISGMAALPKNPRTILAADSIGGRILRINTSENIVSVAFEHAALKPNGHGNATENGIKGLKIRDNHLYFTNSAQRLFGRFPIDANGTNTGDVNILARLDGNDASYDDFSFDEEGNDLVAVHPSSVHKITPEGAQSIVAGGVNATSPEFLEPTSVVVSSKGVVMYVSTAGKDTGFPISGGQVLRVQTGAP
ncbi:hypothetical protein F5Y08DRAFT_327254 [Xylaria arbuscula]|nr:hypothetical protein F5Y08DRAFT_327254 [Xylaria arbuscula]